MISIFIDFHLQRYQREIKYAFSYIFSTLGYSYSFIADTAHLKNRDILLIYGYKEPTVDELKVLARYYTTIFIQCEPELYEPEAYTHEKLKNNLREVKLLSPTPVISARHFEQPAADYSEAEIHAGKIFFDVVGNVFFHLAALESRLEGSPKEGEEFDERTSAFYKYKDNPWVDNLLWLLDSMIKEQVRGKGSYIVQKSYWPAAQQATISLSHSVDRLCKWNFHSFLVSIADDFVMLFSLRWGRLFRELGGKLKYLFSNYELYWNFEEFRKLERDAKCRSTWFIAAENSEETDYSLDDPDLQEEIQHIQREHGEIGLLTTADKLNRDDFVTRKQVLLHLLHKDQIGIRQLGYKNNDQLRDLHNKLNPSYSQSVAMAESPGFKDGFALPWHPWIGSAKASFLEIPTLIRDRYLMINKYKNLPLDDAKRMVKKYFQNCVRVRGVFGVDMRVASWTDIPYMQKLYPYLLALINSADCWVATGTEIASWWEKRSKVTIDETDYEISVYFPEDMDSFALQISGEAKIKEISGAICKVEDNILKFKDVEANSIAVIRLQTNQ